MLSMVGRRAGSSSSTRRVRSDRSIVRSGGRTLIAKRSCGSYQSSISFSEASLMRSPTTSHSRSCSSPWAAMREPAWIRPSMYPRSLRSPGPRLTGIARRDADRPAGLGQQKIEPAVERAGAVMRMPIGSEADVDRYRPAAGKIEQIEHRVEQPARSHKMTSAAPGLHREAKPGPRRCWPCCKHRWRRPRRWPHACRATPRPSATAAPDRAARRAPALPLLPPQPCRPRK